MSDVSDESGNGQGIPTFLWLQNEIRQEVMQQILQINTKVNKHAGEHQE